MEKTDKETLEAVILERLASGESRDDIILDLCETKNMNWSQAEALLLKISDDQAHHIVLAQSPLLVLIALATFVGGIGLVAFSIYDIAYIFRTYWMAEREGVGALNFLLYLFMYGGKLWLLAFLGAGMILGSLRGMQDVWAAIFHKLGILQ